MLGFLAATNHWYSWDAGIKATTALDTSTYATIAAAAPQFPHAAIGSAFTERFAFPWLLGTAGELLGVGTHGPFRVMFALFVLVTLGLLADICRRLGLGVVSSLLCVGVFALNPYVFRGGAIAPGPVDEAFVVGIAVLLWGLVAVRFTGVVAGAAIAILGRQSALLAVPAAGAWLWAGAGWRSPPARERATRIAVPVIAVVALYATLRLSVTSFTYSFAPSIPADTVVPVVGHPGSVSELATHLARIAAPLVVWAGAVAGAFAGHAYAGERLRPPTEFWCAVAIAASIILQPLAISPHFPGFEANEQRLAALGLFPLCVGLAYLVRGAEASLRAAPPWALLAGGGALLAASLHDAYTVVGPATNGQFVALELIAAAVLGTAVAACVAGGGAGSPARARRGRASA